MKAVNGLQMGLVDKYSIERLGIPGVVLMENAALQIVRHVEKFFADEPYRTKTVTIVAGKGNNAGDAFAVARHLIIKGYSTIIYCLFDRAFLMGDTSVNLEILYRLGADVRPLYETQHLMEFKKDLSKAQLIVDGIFGTGFRGQVKGFPADVMEAINLSSVYVLSIDIASGIESASGRVTEGCIKADKTVTFELPKIGQLVFPGAAYTGELAVESISMPRESIDSVEVDTFLTDIQTVRAMLPKRGPDINKGSCGKAAIITGSQGMAGSGCLASKACLRTGSGLVYIGAPKSLLSIYQTVVPEAVGVGLTEYNGVLGQNSIEGILTLIKKCDVAAIGPGLSTNEYIYYIISNIADKIDVPVVLDADALNAMARDTGLFSRFGNKVVITPHPGEMARLTGLDIDYIKENRFEVARKYAKLWGVTLVLKGARTIISDSSGKVHINPTGNSGMATAGSGDSLTGIITSLMGQGADSYDAAVAGVFLHGLAGDYAARHKGEYGLTAMDIVESIPEAIGEVLSSAATDLP